MGFGVSVQGTVSIGVFWALVQGFNVSGHFMETILFIIDPYNGNFHQNSVKATQVSSHGVGVLYNHRFGALGL